MPDLSLKPNLVPLHAWLIEAGTSDVAAEALFDGFCGRLAAACTCRWRSRPQHQKRTFALQQLIRSPRRRGLGASASGSAAALNDAADCQTAKPALSFRRGLSSCLVQRLRIETGLIPLISPSTTRKKSKIG